MISVGTGIRLGLACLLIAIGSTAVAQAVGPTLQLDPHHPWLPPFGLKRIGMSIQVLVAGEPDSKYELVALDGSEELGRQDVVLPEASPAQSTVIAPAATTTLVLNAPATGEIARIAVDRSDLQADAIASPDNVINPVDLGAILVPSDWLLLQGGQQAGVEVAAVSYGGDVPGGEVTVWFGSSPEASQSKPFALLKNHRATAKLSLPPAPVDRENDTVHITIEDAGGAVLWRKAIPVMLVQEPPSWPEFGATKTKLRYDGPISLLARDGTLSEMDYDQGWDPALHDVVVSLPNGARFVFWRGSSYIPFWAGRYNTGLCYEWAETRPPPDGFVDCVEPLMDKELRYGRVEIVESTAERVHVRWTYQSCDFNYKVWGDFAVEDYYFYPDGFGTRELTLQYAPDGDYELSEVILLTPQAAYPFDVLPSNLADVLFLNGEKLEITTPVLADQQAKYEAAPAVPAIYRIRLNKQEKLTGVYFNPKELNMPAVFFAPFYDQGKMVTPAYWGSHWPLARGKTTGGQIDERIAITPSHNSLMSWAFRRPEPIESRLVETEDTLGRTRTMKVERWTWLIGMVDATDEELLARARAYAALPEFSKTGSP